MSNTPSPDRFNFVPASYPPEAFQYHAYMAAPFNLSKSEAKRMVQHIKDSKSYLSDTYQVEMNEVYVSAFGFSMRWLSIKRRDKEAFHDWRELQGIKNAICGHEAEGVELYPAESRLVDTANQYHIWVLPDDKKWPFGYPDRSVISESIGGAKQRQIED